MKLLSKFLLVLGALLICNPISHLMFGVGYLYTPIATDAMVGVLFLQFIVGFLIVSGVLVFRVKP